jgi:hypothetical protein
MIRSGRRRSLAVRQRDASHPPGSVPPPRRLGANRPRGTRRPPGSLRVARRAGGQEGHRAPPYPGPVPAMWGSRRRTSGLHECRKDRDTSPRPPLNSRSPPQATGRAGNEARSPRPRTSRSPSRNSSSSARSRRHGLAGAGVTTRTPWATRITQAPPSVIFTKIVGIHHLLLCTHLLLSYPQQTSHDHCRAAVQLDSGRFAPVW